MTDEKKPVFARPIGYRRWTPRQKLAWAEHYLRRVLKADDERRSANEPLVQVQRALGANPRARMHWEAATERLVCCRLSSREYSRTHVRVGIPGRCGRDGRAGPLAQRTGSDSQKAAPDLPWVS